MDIKILTKELISSAMSNFDKEFIHTAITEKKYNQFCVVTYSFYTL